MAEINPLYPALAEPDHTRPSLFELLAEEQLRDILHPLVRYVLSYLAQHYPRYFLRFLNRHEEVFAGLLLLVERHHLKKHNASLSEHFYQLRLSPSNSIPTPRLNQVDPPRSRPLNRRQRWGMLLVLVGIPYLRARAQDYYERLGGLRGPEDPEPEIQAVSKRQKLFKAIYPYINLAFDVTLIGYDIAYLFERTGDYRPWHRLLGVKVQRRGQEDEESHQSGLLAKLPPLLPPLLLLLKLSQWWYSPTSPRTISISQPGSRTSSAKIHAGILPPRPLPILPASGLLSATPPDSPLLTPPEEEIHTEATDIGGKEYKGFTIPVKEYGTCPICSQKWQNPAILPSGWVVCWRCGWDALEGEEEEEEGEEDAGSEDGSRKSDYGMQESGKTAKGRKGICPITGEYVGPGQLRRVLV